jgi:hypothetical protein
MYYVILVLYIQLYILKLLSVCLTIYPRGTLLYWFTASRSNNQTDNLAWKTASRN